MYIKKRIPVSLSPFFPDRINGPLNETENTGNLGECTGRTPDSISQ